MQRTLSLVLDDDNTIILNLTQEMEASELDKFILSHFENSEDIRKYYKKQIDDFMQTHQAYLNKVQETSQKTFRGWIRLLQVQELHPGEVSLEQVRILYPKHIAAVPSMIQSQATLKEYQKQYNIKANIMGIQRLNRQTKNIVHYFHSRNFKDKHNKKMIADWANSQKGTSSYYERIRLLVKAYEIVRKKMHLPTIDSLYKYIQLEKQAQKKAKKEAPQVSVILEETDEIYIDGTKYTLDEIPSLDAEVVRDTSFHRDGMGPRR